VEYKHFLNQISPHTVIVSETTNDVGEPYYPILNKKNIELYEKYKELAEEEEGYNNVYFVGRLANYKYFNMDQAILNAIALFNDKIKIVKYI
jgi:UDP-galactopyranose mutase